MAFKVPEEHRVQQGRLATTILDGNNGAFVFKKDGVMYYCIASDGGGWEHVSVSLDRKRCPDWEEMCMIKRLFWGPEDCVLQYHPPESDYVNCYEFCLHLWRPTGVEVPSPPSIFVGPR